MPTGPELPPLPEHLSAAMFVMRCPHCRIPCEARFVSFDQPLDQPRTWHCSQHGEVEPERFPPVSGTRENGDRR